MYYAGIDYHKRYSVVIIQNEQGQIVQERRVDPAYPEGVSEAVPGVPGARLRRL